MGLSVEKLKAAAKTKDISKAKKIKLITSGGCSDTFIKEFSLFIYNGASSFPMMLGRILGITPVYHARLYLLENIMEEEGITYSSRNGVQENNKSRHVEWALRFAQKTGHPENTLHNSNVSNSNKTFNNYINSRDWLGAIAYYLAGMESNTPEMCRLVVNGLSKKGFSHEDLAFFNNHITLDELHGDKAFNILSEWSDERNSDAIIEAIKKGARHWWHMFN